MLEQESFEMLLHLYHRALEHYEAAAALDVRALAVLMYGTIWHNDLVH